MREASPEEVTQALSRTLRYEERRRVYHAELTMAQIHRRAAGGTPTGVRVCGNEERLG
jgi:predicted NAD/FAD-binding protein